MPTLNWIGKDKVINHHQQVPFRTLEPRYAHGAPDSGNMIIHGDNLDALKALLPQYEGKVKCIYIDPPYNTGNEGWVYNDNVNDPKIRKWLGEVVGKEGEDLSRHDKWLCMMYPRLRLLQRLLADDGAIFISIDDVEIANLRLICNEIFGANCFITDCVWRSSDNSNNNSLKFSEDYNHTLVYAKKNDWHPNFINDENKRKHFRNPDNDPRGAWFDGNPVNNPGWRPNLQFNITTPSGNIIKHPTNGWRWSLETINEKLAIGELRFSEDETRLIRRTYLSELGGLTPSNLWIDLERTSHTRRAKYDLKQIFPEIKPTDLFSTPKPSKFIEYILELATNPGDIVLDSFAGSGTTAHAALNIGNRQFILVETMDYAETITAERVKRVIDGYGGSDGTGGGFTYYELGEPLLFPDGNLNENVGTEKIYEYVWYMETRSAYAPQDEPYLLGVRANTAYYFYYEPKEVTTLDHTFLSTVKTKAGGYTIYADLNALSAAEMDEYRITFKKIPRDIAKL